MASVWAPSRSPWVLVEVKLKDMSHTRLVESTASTRTFCSDGDAPCLRRPVRQALATGGQ